MATLFDNPIYNQSIASTLYEMELRLLGSKILNNTNARGVVSYAYTNSNGNKIYHIMNWIEKDGEIILLDAGNHFYGTVDEFMERVAKKGIIIDEIQYGTTGKINDSE